MKHSTYDLYVVYSSGGYCNASLSGDEVFTDKAGAEAELVKVKEDAAKMNLTSSLNFHITTLDDFMSMQREDARDEGRQAEQQTDY